MAPLTLTSQQFARLCTVIEVPYPESDEQVKNSRVEHRTTVHVALVEGGTILPPVVSTLRDLTPKGSTLRHPTALKPGSHVVYYLGGENNPIRVIGKVSHCKCFADGTALVGIQFTGFVDPRARKMA